MSLTYFYLIIFGFLAYLICTDSSIARFFVYIVEIIRIRGYKILWWLRYNPRNPIVKYIMWRRAIQMAKELQKELEEKS